MSYELWHGDCLVEMSRIPDGSVDLIVTSPPYDNLRTYNDTLLWSYEIFRSIAIEMTRCLKNGGVIVWIVNDATIKGSETGSSFKQALYFKESCGLRIHDTMIWNKSVTPHQDKNRYIPAFEYMFVFSKGAPKTFNIIKDRKNNSPGRMAGGTTQRMSRGHTEKRTQRNIVKEYGIRLNIWNISPEFNNKTIHPAVFPIKLVSDHVITWSNEGDLILDPFSGSGTTGLACLNLNRNFIGIEKDDKYFQVASDRMAKHVVKPIQMDLAK